MGSLRWCDDHSRATTATCTRNSPVRIHTTAHPLAIPVLRVHQIPKYQYSYLDINLGEWPRWIDQSSALPVSFEYAPGIWYILLRSSGQAVTDPIGSARKEMLKGIPTLRKVLTPRALKPLVLLGLGV